MKIRLMHSRFLPLLLIGSSMLAGCTSMQKSSFKEMSAAYREVVEQYSNDNILLNIVRSSRNMPMSFLDIPTVAGSGTWSASPGTQRFLSDYTFTNNNYFSHSLGLSVSNSFTFQQASLDNAQFMSAFYKEIDLESINFKGTEQRLPKAIIYTLLIDSIELHSSDKFQIQKWVNDPLLPNYRAFQSALNVMIDVGLTTELVSYKSPIGPPFSAEEFTKNLGPWTTALANNKAAGIEYDKITIDDKAFYQPYSWKQYTRFCVNGYSAKELLGKQLAETAYCADSPKIKLSKNSKASAIHAFTEVQGNASNFQLAIKLRSRGNVFDFLGNVLRAQHEASPQLVTVQPPKTAEGLSDTQASEVPLFLVQKNTFNAQPLMNVSYRGDSYSILDEDVSYTKQVLEFMSTSINLAKIPGSIPAASSIIIR